MTRYVLGERIGVGGMAEIFRGMAVAAGGFEKPVAIKRILPHLSQDQRFVNLLIGEARLLSQLRHRNIVQIFDLGLGEDGQFFLVMEYVDGADLGALYEKLEQARKRLPLELSLHIVAEVCDALDYAHRARGPEDEPLGIVHRDVSPANVLLSRSGEVKLTDFGIAKNAEEHTGHGGVRGKFAYIAPEQAVNKRVDGRSDVYSAGVVLYELVLGHRLYSGLPDFDALRAVRDGGIKRPSEIDAEIDPRLEELLMTALSTDPDGRFATAGKMGAELRTLRYSLSDAGGDPAAEIARILEKAAAPVGKTRRKREVTVVRIQTAAGFAATGFETFVGETAKQWDLDEFDDDEETQALEARSLLARPQRGDSHVQTDELALVEVPSVGGGAVRLPAGASAPRNAAAGRAATPSPGPRPVGIEPHLPERAATPTIRDLFHTGALLDSGAVGAASSASIPQQRLLSDGEVLRRPRQRRLIMLAVVAVVVAGASFGVASMFLGGDREPSVIVPPDIIDASMPDAAEELVMPPDPITP
ncbi:MAG TPA: serine/threonine-protein kinase, partial [Kofleriaceae bacterium]|nr:serine/threonine-protein kinase [Kofleriaceae bacterium]